MGQIDGEGSVTSQLNQPDVEQLRGPQVWAEPFLWIHGLGIAAVPLWILVILIGLATGDPLLPVGLEKLLVEWAVLPVVWMQAHRPFYIFSIVAVSLPPEELDQSQRQILTGFRQSLYRHVVLPGVSVVLVGFVGWCYHVAPLFARLSPIHQAAGSRLSGLVIAVVGVLGLALFSQIPAAVGLLLVQPNDETQAWDPVPVERIRAEYSVSGWPFKKLGTWFPRWDQPSTEEVVDSSGPLGLVDPPETAKTELERVEPKDPSVESELSQSEASQAPEAGDPVE